jgi:hypothetical protein
VRSAQTGIPLGLPFDIAVGELSPSAVSIAAAVFVTVDDGDEQIVTVGSRLTAWADAIGPPLLRALLPTASASLPMTDAETSARAKIPREPDSQIELRAWTSDGRMIATLRESSIQTTGGFIAASRRLVVYSLETDPPTVVPLGDPSPRGSDVVAAFSSDGATLFVADHAVVKAVDVRADVGRSLVLFAQTADVSALATAVDGSLAVATAAGDVRVISPEELEELQRRAIERKQRAETTIPLPDRSLGLEAPSHSAHVVGAWFDSTAKLLVTQDSAGVTHVVSTADRVLLVELHGATPGGRVAVSDRDLYVEGPQGVQQWRLDTDTFESLACALAGQPFSAADRVSFGILEGPVRCR